MIRAGLVAMALLGAGQASAAEGGPIRTGEHQGFSRAVFRIEPVTEWSLETGPEEAVIFFPGKALSFGTAGIFERMPPTRIRGIAARTEADGTRVLVAIGCDCRVSASFVGGRYLALDVADRDHVPETPEDDVRAELETRRVAAAEAVLVAQIERAADQGLIRLAAPSADQGAPDTSAGRGPGPVPTAEIAPAARAPDERAAPVLPSRIDTLAGLPGLIMGEQIEAVTVFDREVAKRAARMATVPAAAGCLPDGLFDIAHWSRGEALFAEAPDLAARLLGEFDRPDPEAIANLARLEIRFGFGREAETLLAGFETPIDNGALLADLARAVEGRAVAPDGPLALGGACPGRHALWLAIGGAAPVFRDGRDFAATATAFAELPPDLRALLGPGLTQRLLDAGRIGPARIIQDIAARPGGRASAEARLSEALLVAEEGDKVAAAAMLRDLLAEHPANARAALSRLARLVIDADLEAPADLATDLATAAAEARGGSEEAGLRALLAETLAHSGAFARAFSEIDTARAALPREAARFEKLAVALLVDAEPARTGAAVYAGVALASGGLLDPGPRDDEARRVIAAHLIDLGLPRVAAGLLEPAIGRGAPATRILAARADLALGRDMAALALLAGLGGPEAAELRAGALALSGDYAGAADALRAAGLDTEASDYAWSSGDWSRAAAGTQDPERRVLADYMAGRTGPARAASGEEPTAPDPEQPFLAPLPRLDQPSLEAARRLLASGPGVGGMVRSLLEDTP